MLFRTTKEIGDWGERRAVHYLRLRGYTVKERNWVSGKSEIDIIAATLKDIVFVEVKRKLKPSFICHDSWTPIFCFCFRNLIGRQGIACRRPSEARAILGLVGSKNRKSESTK